MTTEDEDLEGPATGRALPRSSAAVFIDDGDRAFLYRAVSVHALAGIGPAEALASIHEALGEVAQDDAAPAPSLPRRLEGARRLLDGIAACPADGPLDRSVQSAGFRLSPLERACLRLPGGALSKPAVAAALFGALADLFPTDRRR